MRVLLTGGAGYIGSHTAVELLGDKNEVIIADDNSNSSSIVIDRIEKITNIRPAEIVVDITNGKAVDKIFELHKVDAVIHLAGFKAVGESVKEPLKYYRNNIDSTLTLLECMKRHNVKKLVFSSSATVYGVPKKVPLTEDMPLSATNPYGQTKLMIEQILRDVALSDDEWSIVLLRYFNPVGAHESGLIGESPNGIPNNLMPYVAKVASGTLEKLHVFGNDYPTPDGTGVRDYIHVVDLAKGHLAALKYAESNNGLSVFNLGTGRPYSVLEMVEAFKKASGKDIPYVIDPRRPGDVAECYADSQKAYCELGWKAEKTLDDMCRDAWRWQENNPNGY